MEKVHKIGDTESPDAKVVRIIHISDTHMEHDKYINNIPDGDILIHSGDFGSYQFKRHLNSSRDFQSQIQEMDDFFKKLPHKYKIFVAGNHETSFPSKKPAFIEDSLKNGIYLQDSFVIIEGIKIYGSPWNNYRMYSFARSFAISHADLRPKWAIIPDDIDVLVTHLPAHGIMDLACVSPWKKLWRDEGYCDRCKQSHDSRPYINEHWGSPTLREAVFSKRIKAHLFGHVHGANGVEVENNVLFSNAAMKCIPQTNIIDYYTTKTETCTEPEYSQPLHTHKGCVIM